MDERGKEGKEGRREERTTRMPMFSIVLMRSVWGLALRRALREGLGMRGRMRGVVPMVEEGGEDGCREKASERGERDFFP
jgi:hypothetical protein